MGRSDKGRQMVRSRKHQQGEVGITFLQRAKCLMEWGSGVIFFFLSHLASEHVYTVVSNAGNGRRARRGAAYGCTSIKTAHVFCFLHVFSFPNYAQTSESDRTRGGVCLCVWGGLSPHQR